MGREKEVGMEAGAVGAEEEVEEEEQVEVVVEVEVRVLEMGMGLDTEVDLVMGQDPATEGKIHHEA